MKLTVYIDILILVNTIINFYLLKISLVILKLTVEIKRVLFAALIGALCSLAILFNLNNYIAVTVRFLSVIIAGYTAFGFVNYKVFLRNISSLTVTNALYTGFVYKFLADNRFTYINNYFCYIHINPVIFVASVTMIYFIMWIAEIIFVNSYKDCNFKFNIQIENNEKSFSAFYDTGFKVKDIIGGKAVMMCGIDDLKTILSTEKISEINKFLKGDMDNSIFTPLFYSDISGRGMLPCIKPDKVSYKNRELRNTVIAVTDKKIDKDVQIIFGKEVFNLTGE